MRWADRAEASDPAAARKTRLKTDSGRRPEQETRADRPESGERLGRSRETNTQGRTRLYLKVYHNKAKTSWLPRHWF